MYASSFLGNKIFLRNMRNREMQLVKHFHYNKTLLVHQNYLRYIQILDLLKNKSLTKIRKESLKSATNDPGQPINLKNTMSLLFCLA